MGFKSFFLRNTYWLNDWLHGSPIRKEYREIKKIMKGSDAGEAIREKKLKDLLRYAVDNCLFYKPYNPNDLSSFPVVNKAILIDNYEKVKVPDDKIPGQQGKVHIQSTSGSTGIPFRVPQDTRKRNRRIAELKYFGDIVGFKSHEPLCQLRIWTVWQSKSKWQALKENIFPFNISDMSDESLEKLVNMINANDVVAIRSYASSYKHIADFVKRKKYKMPSLQICIAGSEALEEDVREAVHKYMECNIISQYADEECGILAQEHLYSEPNKQYLNHASYYFEILKMDSDEPAGFGELGRVIITDLTNRAFPLIRYDTGDLAILHSPDQWSSGYPFFSSLYGRRIDLVYNTTGAPVHPMVLNRVLKNFDNIVQWQFIQKGEKQYLLKLKSNLVMEELIVEELRHYFGKDATIKIEYVDDIPVLKSGKRKAVVNEWTTKGN